MLVAQSIDALTICIIKVTFKCDQTSQLNTELDTNNDKKILSLIDNRHWINYITSQGPYLNK